MNITAIETEILSYRKQLAESPKVQGDLKNVKTAIIAIIDNEIAKERP
jgi:hypothetical protein